jgi:hypothetical protein
MKRRVKRLEREIETGEEKPSYIFRVKQPDGTTIDQVQRVKGHEGKPVIIDCDEADMLL